MSSEKKDITSWANKEGSFKRQVSSFRDVIEPNGKFAPEKGRYHLYVSLACPWAHRTLIVRKLKGLEDFIDVSTVHPHMLEKGWHFVTPDNAKSTAAPASEHSNDTFPAATQDHLFGFSHLRELYFKAQPDYDARFTVPVVWDKKTNSLVNNESSETVRFLNTAFNELIEDKSAKELDLYPEELRKEIDELNEWVYNDINNGVYKSGFATTQKAYEDAVKPLSKALERIEERLSDGRDFLVGGRLTEADVRLYTTIVRYDPVYYVHFKCNFGLIRHDYPHLHKWLQKLYWNNPAFKDTTNFEHIKEHYYYSHKQLNPNRIVPYGPNVDIEPLK
ncbi:glutathione S-transferase Gst3 [Kwoniella heveanensis BCC8398]|uniref:Glutathione S-transferase omega-like 2 n=1 Tax=Kwoniella heveanensis BCC8398 TaxID=1296120 RepID=A0A1B9GYK1_9TREE|nr:glutathione S-transferase Gst3 [Kwoniella heveanensis BCC8398]